MKTHRNCIQALSFFLLLFFAHSALANNSLSVRHYCSHLQARGCAGSCATDSNGLKRIESIWKKKQSKLNFYERYSRNTGQSNISFQIKPDKSGAPKIHASKSGQSQAVKAQLCHAKYNGKEDIFVHITNYNGKPVSLFINYIPSNEGLMLKVRVPLEGNGYFKRNKIISKTLPLNGAYQATPFSPVRRSVARAPGPARRTFARQ